MKYSLLVPTRDRINFLDGLITSIISNTSNLNNVEVLFACDIEDESSQNKIIELQKQHKELSISLYIRERTAFLNKDYYNWLGTKANGDMLWVIGDDTILTVKDWDKIVTENLNNFFERNKDRVVCVSLMDNTPPPSSRMPKFPCFPMFSKEAIEACGWMLNPMTPTWGADYITYCIYEPIGRLLQLHDRVYINHISHHTQQVKLDDIGERIGNIFNALKMIPKYNTDRFIAKEVPRIKEKILNYIGGIR